MSSHQTVVIELGSSRVKVGFAGESKPRRILHDSGSVVDRGGWSVGVNDSMVSRACNWPAFFQYLSSPLATNTDGPVTPATTVGEWEKTLHPLFSHILTSILFIQRPYTRHRALCLINDAFPPRHFREALHRVLLKYLGMGGVWLVNRGTFEGLYCLIEGLPPSVSSSGPPKAHLLVDIGTHEARALVSVAGSSILENTHQSTMAGYHSFLRQVLANYQKMNEKVEKVETESQVATLEDANSVVQAWVSLPSMLSEISSISVKLPSLEKGQHQTQAPIETSIYLPIKPLLQAFHQIYLDYTNPSSLIFAMLTSVMACPIDYRKVALHNVLLLGGGSVAMRHFGSPEIVELKRESINSFDLQLEMAARDACGLSRIKIMGENTEEEKKEDNPFATSSIARQRFQSLKGCVDIAINSEGNRMGGINVQYPDPFAADMAAWIGGSILGTLSFKHYEKRK